ncbi:hypothetical protein [Methanosarcina acetivorans]|uniref:Uncharacterized protein n=1 Tax=Methanosarcina acetivorans (strain ATCC 35395 / DSM 2834 / JCM 12185 / C2A) TaxID=188937 RepID=Q8TQA7_METAC|nr:hypothetical protein [Methanosarcina acetivorans]AAM05051.1 predicted protein [Methanosarcina acetivorans C2A]
MTTDKLFESLEKIVEKSQDYLVIGSLSFLPLLKNYREPGIDLDISIEKGLFYRRKNIVEAIGNIQVLRLNEIAVANKSFVSKLISPKTDFIHLETKEGLLDIQLYEHKKESIEIKLGMGFSLSLPNSIIKRSKILKWKGHSYRAAPLEWMFATKSVEYLQAKEENRLNDFMKTKHYNDLKMMATIVDWDFLKDFLKDLELKWNGFKVPRFIDKKINPLYSINIKLLKRDLLQ